MPVPTDRMPLKTANQPDCNCHYKATLKMSMKQKSNTISDRQACHKNANIGLLGSENASWQPWSETRQ